jgi:RimJ/RimL family protein N-acetyltransferase
MSEYPKRLNLRAEKTVEIRPLETSDEGALIAFFASLPPEATHYLRHDVKDPEVVRQFVREHDPLKVWPILAVDGDEVVADATLRVDQIGWRRHVGEIRVVVAPGYQKFGLATALIHELVNQASLRELRKLEAQILGNQTGARTAFERLGFREEARLKDHALDHNKNLHDIVILTNTVDDLWAKMEDMLADNGWDRH